MSGRTATRLAAIVLAAAVIATAILVGTRAGSGWRERQEQRAEEAAMARAAHYARIAAGVEECRTKGGVPITHGWSGALVRCDFPRRP